MGYTNVRHYHGGLADWQEYGAPLDSGSLSIDTVVSKPGPLPSRDLSAETNTSFTARLRRFQLADRLADFIDRQSTVRLFLVWMGMTLAFGAIYWLAGLFHHSGLLETGRWIDGSEHGLWSAIYFSFVTVTSVGYGDVVPRGVARVAAISEAVTGLLIFGAVVAKFVSRRQDEVVREIHRVTFDERIDRIQTNLHMLLSELQSIAMMYDDGIGRVERLNARLESATLVFAAELRTVHYLLYRPAQAPEEPVLEGILASLASALQALYDCLHSRPDEVVNSPLLVETVKTLSRLASEICGNCVPAVYAPGLTLWMDRIQEIAARLA
ncbi:MAG: ion channel [Candidatus Binataceae bacterium]